jgi:hypothetical protein
MRTGSASVLSLASGWLTPGALLSGGLVSGGARSFAGTLFSLGTVFCVGTLSGCGGEGDKVRVHDTADPGDTDDADDTDDTGPGETDVDLPDLPTSGCGGASYTWLPTDATGEVLASERDDVFSLPAATLDALLSGQGLEQFTPVAHGVELYRVRYTTQDRGELVEVTGYAAFPDVAEPVSVPLLLWLHPTMGFSDACSPTAIGLAGAAFPVLMAALGYAVAAPDFIGMNGWGEGSDRPHPWAVAEPTAVASLDMGRATIALAAELGLAATPDASRTVAWGASQGGHAAFFVDRYAPGYAPELTPKAVVAAIPPTDLRALAERGVEEWGATTAGIAGALVAESRWYGFGEPLDGVLQPDLAVAMPAAMDTLCSDFEVGEDVDEISEVYQDTFVSAVSAGAWDTVDPWSCALAESSVVDSPVPYRSTAPVLLIAGENDDLIYAPTIRDDVEPLCDLGYVIQYVECAGADHVSAAVQTLPMQVAWVEGVLDGAPRAGTCAVTAPIDCDAP